MNAVVTQRVIESIKLFKDVSEEDLAFRENVDMPSAMEQIVGSSAALRRVLLHVAKVAPTDSTVLIKGETGTGKELIARAIHEGSCRSGKSFVRVNCAALPPSLIAAELFGHEKGAFTGAGQRRLGRFELADGGTIFLDEIGDIPAETQIALLRVLQEREFERVGGTRPISVDVRVIVATNRDLTADMHSGRFRSDLFYRLDVFPIQVPALRERAEDIPLLVDSFIARHARKAGKKITNVQHYALERLQRYRWPGNIRELQNVIERAVILSDDETLSFDDVGLQHPTHDPSFHPVAVIDSIEGRERQRIESALAECKGRVSGPRGAASRLGMPRSTMEAKLRSLRINRYRFKLG
ncbi:MAG: formate hydrogenlyase transcriptional activator [Betaproteobacteria bacterium]|nr:formate hydrogenlyase transcriptional activator [Betaproteobacteria bacterium]